jgi:hypothetical protein
MDESLEKTQPQYPTLPELNDHRWQQASIQTRTRSTVELRSQPRPGLSKSLATLKTGDLVNVIREVRHETWIAVKVGRLRGWMDAAGVGFTMSRMPISQAASRPSAPFSTASQSDTQNHNDDETRPTLEEAGLYLTAQEANYIFTHLRGIATTLQTARERARREMLRETL